MNEKMIIETLEDLKKLKYSDFHWLIISTLQNRAGSAKKKIIVDEIIQNNIFSEEVLNEKTSDGREGKISNMIAWGRFYLRTNGYLKPDSPRGLWELSDKGITATESEFSNPKFAPNMSTKDDIENPIKDEDELPWRIELRKALSKLSPQKFETFARSLIAKMGVDIDEKIGISAVADGGIDGFGYFKSSDDFRTTRVAVQAKRWNGQVGSPEIDKFRGAMDKYNAEFGIFITTSTFSKPAKEASRIGTRVITLIDGDEIADLVAKYQLYVKPIEAYELGGFYNE